MPAIALISCMIFAGSVAPPVGPGLPYVVRGVVGGASTSPADRASDHIGKIATLHKKYDEARDPVHRAKALAQLGEAQVKDAGERLAARDYAGALTELRQYRDEVVSVRRELVATGVNPERKPGGFRELQLSVRENLQRIESISFAASASQQTPLVEIHEQLGQENERLLTALFPSAPEGGAATRPGHP
jgi:hypothetical protein